MQEDIRIATLSNGIRVVTQKRDSEAAAFVFMIGCGGRNEPDELVGLSHGLEHSMFKGTPTRTASEIAIDTEGIGANINAFTDVENTAYLFFAPVDTFRAVAEVYADTLHNSLLDEKEWEKERKVILEERLMYEESNLKCAPMVLLPEIMFNLQMGVIGSAETIQRIQPIHMRNLIKEWYLPENIIISIAGGVDHNNAFDVAEDLFSNFHKAWDLGNRLPSLKALPPHSKSRYVEKIFNGCEQAGIAIGFRAYSRADERRYATSILSQALGTGLSSRLFQEVREKKGLVYTVRSSYEPFMDSGVFLIRAYSTQPVKAFSVIMDELYKISNGKPVEGKELINAKTAVKAYFMKQEASLGFAIQNANSLLFRGKVIPRFEQYRMLDNVTPEAISAVARDMLNRSNMTVAITSASTLENEIIPFLMSK